MATTRTRRSKIKESAGGGGVGRSRNADPKRVMERGGRKKEGKRRSVDGGDEMKKKKRKEDDGGSEMHVERSEIRGEDEQKRKEEEDDGGSGMHVERSENRGEDEQNRKKKEEEEEDDGGSEMHVERSKDRGKDDKERSGDGDGDGERPKPVGGAVESGGNVKRYSAFDYDGRRYQLEDSVLVTPAEENTRPGVGIIKEISEALDGSMSVTVQWFYRPEDLETADEESWLSLDNRELLISNDQDEVPAESLMHNCVVHFLAQWKQLPDRKKHPGFVVLYFYDHLNQKVYKITDEDYMDSLQKEIHQRIQDTQLRIGFEDSSPTNNDQGTKNRCKI